MQFPAAQRWFIVCMCYKIIKSFKYEPVNTVVSLSLYMLQEILERIIDFI